MSSKKNVTISIGTENNAEAWWIAALAADKTGLPVSCISLISSTANSVTVSAKDSERFRAWGSALPGWADGPSHAVEPFVLNPAE